MNLNLYDKHSAVYNAQNVQLIKNLLDYVVESLIGSILQVLL